MSPFCLSSRLLLQILHGWHDAATLPWNLLGICNYRVGQYPTLRECPMSGHCLDLLLACALAYLGRHAGLIIQPHQHLRTVPFLASQSEGYRAGPHTYSILSYL